MIINPLLVREQVPHSFNGVVTKPEFGGIWPCGGEVGCGIKEVEVEWGRLDIKSSVQHT